MRIDVHIERLVLEGVECSPAERRELQSAFPAELESQLAISGPGLDSIAGGAVPRASAAAEVSLGENRTLARGIATAVAGAIAR
jgi:hypothetical protein